MVLALTHEAAPQSEVVLVALGVDGGQGVQQLLQDQQSVLEVRVRLEPLLEWLACGD
jgi:hypothetical protein